MKMLLKLFTIFFLMSVTYFIGFTIGKMVQSEYTMSAQGYWTEKYLLYINTLLLNNDDELASESIRHVLDNIIVFKNGIEYESLIKNEISQEKESEKGP